MTFSAKTFSKPFKDSVVTFKWFLAKVAVLYSDIFRSIIFDILNVLRIKIKIIQCQSKAMLPKPRDGKGKKFNSFFAMP